MLFLLLIATLSVVFAEEAEVKPIEKVEPKPAESAHLNKMGHSFRDGLELMRHREQSLHSDRMHMMENDGYHHDDRHSAHGLDEYGPVILRTPHPLPSDGHPDIKAQNKIIADVFSPDFYQPTWVLDYRYLKTGGRDYTRGPGGQILILPKGVRSKEHKEFPDYDAYLEHLRLSRLSEMQHHKHDHHGYGHHHESHGHSHGHGYGYGHNEHDRGHGHGQTMWHKYG